MKAKDWAKQLQNGKTTTEVINDFIKETLELYQKRKDLESSMREQQQKWEAVVKIINNEEICTKDDFFQAFSYEQKRLWERYCDKSAYVWSLREHKKLRHEYAQERARIDRIPDGELRLGYLIAAMIENADRIREIDFLSGGNTGHRH